jgi:hypothetical protein
VRSLLRGVFEFVVGDDLPTAFGVVLSLAATALLAASDLAAWWLMPLAAVALLRASLLRRVRTLPPQPAVGSGRAGSSPAARGERLDPEPPAQRDSVAAAPGSRPGGSPPRANSGSEPRPA